MLNGPKTRPRGWETPFVAGIGRGRRTCGPKSPAGVAGTGTRFSNTRAWALTPNHFIQRSSQKPGALSGLPPPREGGAAAPPSREAAGGRVRPTAQTLFGRAGESARMAAAGPERAGWERGTAPPSARPRPRPPLPFWERIASPVLRSPKTDRGPSIFAAGYTPSFSRTADKSRPDPLSPATAWNANKRRRRGCWERRPPNPAPRPSRGAGRERMTGGGRRKARTGRKPAPRSSHRIRERIGRARRWENGSQGLGPLEEEGALQQLPRRHGLRVRVCTF